MKYPLEPLLELRRHQVDEGASALGDAIRIREAAERDRARAEALHREAEAAVRAVRDREAGLLADGALRAVDLARADAWKLGADAEIARLSARESACAARVDDTTTAEGAARTDLAQRMAERDVIVKDQARFTERARARALSAEEEAAEEARRGGR